MIPHIRNITPPADSTPYNPAKFVSVPANGTVSITLAGRNSELFGFDRMLPGSPSPDAITVTAILNEEIILFKDVKLSAIIQHFKHLKLLAPYVIQQNNNLVFELTNSTGAAVPVNMQLLGYDAPGVRALQAAYKNKGVRMPEPIFLFANATVPASAQSFAINIPTKPVNLRLLRSTIVTEDDNDITVSMKVYNETIKNQVFVEQFNQEYESSYPFIPFEVGVSVPFTLQADNLDGANAHDLHFLGEAYVMHKTNES